MWIRFLTDELAYVPMQWAWMQPNLVVASLAISLSSAMLAMFLAAKAQQGQHRVLKRWASAVALGGGSWATHLVGMEAFTPCGSGNFSLLHSGLSLLPSLLAAGGVLYTLGHPQRNWLHLLCSGGVLGLAMAVTHFWGMRASEATHYMDYAPWVLALALALSTSLCWLSVTLYQRLQSQGTAAVYTAVFSGSLIGLATACMHYIAMDAIHLPVGPDPTHSVPLESHWTPVTIGASAVLLLVVAVLALHLGLGWRQSFSDKRSRFACSGGHGGGRHHHD